jgi:hypothetical protein
MNRNARRTLSCARTVADMILEGKSPSKNLAQGKLRTRLWWRLRVTPFRNVTRSESPSGVPI